MANTDRYNWRGPSRPVRFAKPEPLIGESNKLFTHSMCLPEYFHVRAANLLTITTRPEIVPLAETWQRLNLQWSFPSLWSRFWHLGDIDYGQAEAWLCMEEVTGFLYAIDIEIDDPVYYVNRSLATMCRSMAHFADWHSETGGGQTNLDKLRSRLSDDELLTADELDPFWYMFLNSITDTGVDEFTVSCNLKTG